MFSCVPAPRFLTKTTIEVAFKKGMTLIYLRCHSEKEEYSLLNTLCCWETEGRKNALEKKKENSFRYSHTEKM